MAEKKEKKKKPGRKAYLNDIQPNLEGEYVYTGKHYHFVPGKKSWERASREIAFFSILTLAAFAGAGFTEAGGMGNCFYVLIPYMAEAISLFLLLWSGGKMAFKGGKIREYIFKSSAARIPGACLCTAAFAALGIVCISVFLVLNGTDGSVGELAALYLCKVLSIVSALLLRRLMKSLSWSLS